MKYWIIGYDICDPKRLRKVARCMQKHAVALQYSVFLFCGNHRQYALCIEEVLKLIDQDRDDLRSYRLSSAGYKERIGEGVLPCGIFLSRLPVTLR